MESRVYIAADFRRSPAVLFIGEGQSKRSLTAYDIYSPHKKGSEVVL